MWWKYTERIFNLISYRDVDFVYVWTYLYLLDLSLSTAVEDFPASPEHLPPLIPQLAPSESVISHLYPDRAQKIQSVGDIDGNDNRKLSLRNGKLIWQWGVGDSEGKFGTHPLAFSLKATKRLPYFRYTVQALSDSASLSFASLLNWNSQDSV